MTANPWLGVSVHLMGIGGAGVSALAPLLLARGARVSGCDAAASATTERLRASGVAVRLGHDPSHIDDADVVVHTAAISPDHPELAAARAAGKRVLGRGACLSELTAGLRTVAVSGSHGKTTTTWMAGHLLERSGADPLVMVGGTVASLGGGARAGRSALAVAEVDESDGSFAGVVPTVAIVTNLDAEHLRHYGSMDGLHEAFHRWLARVPADGLVVAPSQGLPGRLLDGLAAPVLRVGLDGGDLTTARLELGVEGSRCHAILHGEDLGLLTVPIPGAHMVTNALMAVAAARFLHPAVRLEDLASCERVGRRFRVHGLGGGVRVVEDYGHHPTEIRATISAARLGGGRVHVLFQPHRYTRTADCFADFVSAFDQAQRVALVPVYAAGERPIPHATSEHLAHAIDSRRGGDGSVIAGEYGVAEAFATAQAQPGDTLLILGAGDVGAAAPRCLERLRCRHPVHPPSLTSV